jgi:hypothetical protein
MRVFDLVECARAGRKLGSMPAAALACFVLEKEEQK